MKKISYKSSEPKKIACLKGEIANADAMLEAQYTDLNSIWDWRGGMKLGLS
jgi:hypothetical protein